MRWITRPRQPRKTPEEVHDTRVAVVVEKEASKEIAEKAKEASRTLNELLEANHFTIKIYRAARTGDVVKQKGS